MRMGCGVFLNWSFHGRTWEAGLVRWATVPAGGRRTGDGPLPRWSWSESLWPASCGHAPVPTRTRCCLRCPWAWHSSCLLYFAAIAVATYWAWWTGHMDRLEVSTDGITYGEETWTWSQIQAVRVTTLANRRINCLRLWTRHRRGIGRVLTFDDALTQADLVRLASRLRPYCQDCDIDNIHR
jgi:hypothetical protein